MDSGARVLAQGIHQNNLERYAALLTTGFAWWFFLLRHLAFTQIFPVKKKFFKLNTVKFTQPSIFLNLKHFKNEPEKNYSIAPPCNEPYNRNACAGIG